jgi:hypothetical protein
MLRLIVLNEGLIPSAPNLVVADASRTKRQSALQFLHLSKLTEYPDAHGLFEVVQVSRKTMASVQESAWSKFTGSSYYADELKESRSLRMICHSTAADAHIIECSTKIYKVYLNYDAPEEIMSTRLMSLHRANTLSEHYHLTARERL